jgi:hypothetical protein
VLVEEGGDRNSETSTNIDDAAELEAERLLTGDRAVRKESLIDRISRRFSAVERIDCDHAAALKSPSPSSDLSAAHFQRKKVPNLFPKNSSAGCIVIFCNSLCCVVLCCAVLHSTAVVRLTKHVQELIASAKGRSRSDNVFMQRPSPRRSSASHFSNISPRPALQTPREMTTSAQRCSSKSFIVSKLHGSAHCKQTQTIPDDLSSGRTQTCRHLPPTKQFHENIQTSDILISH